jgi:prepilin-type N-terminal cleavage/methylation domain-containing protein
MCQFLPRHPEVLVHRQTTEPEGFTLLEVLVSITILAIGMMASALLMSNAYKYSVRSRYVSEAAQLASEKLEDLNRFPAVNTLTASNYTVIEPDEHIFVPSGQTCQITATTTEASCVGSIAPALTCTSPGHCTQNAAASSLSITALEAGAGGTQSLGTGTVNYADAVYISATNASGTGGTTANGTLQETFQTGSGASLTYTTLSFSPNGTTPLASTSTTPPAGAETFDRRWIIEQDQPVAGVRRITVLVTLIDQTVQPPVTYQMSMVRP